MAISIAYADCGKELSSCRFYGENLRLLAAFGAELVPLSLACDRKIPPRCRALYLGGEMLERTVFQAADNLSLLAGVRAFCRSGFPVIAEGAGFLYLQLAGLLSGTFEKKAGPESPRNVTLRAEIDTFLCKKGDSLQAFEALPFAVSDSGSSCTATDAAGKQYPCIVCAMPLAAAPQACCRKKGQGEPSIFAGTPYLSFSSNPDFALAFVAAASRAAAAGTGGCQGCASSGGKKCASSCGGCCSGVAAPAGTS